MATKIHRTELEVTESRPAWLTIQVVAAKSNRPLGDVWVSVQRQDEMPWLLPEGYTDPRGILELEVASGHDLLLKTKFDFEKRVSALEAGERRGVLLAIHKLEERFFGRVVALEDGRPLSGVQIRRYPMKTLHVARRSLDSGEADTESDEQGHFELPALDERNQYCTLVGPGTSPLLCRLDEDNMSPDGALLVEVTGSSVLHGVISGAEGPIQLRASGNLEVHQDIPWDARTQMYHSFVQDVEADGSFRMGDLPSFTPLKIEVVGEAHRTLEIAEAIVLKPGESRRIDRSFDHAVKVSGTVLGPGARPVPGARIWLVRESKTLGTMTPMTRPAQSCVSDVLGRFLLEPVPPGSWLVGLDPGYVLASSRPDLRAPCASESVRLVVEAGRPPAPLTLEIEEGLYIRGRVLGLNGEGAKFAAVSARLKSNGAPAGVITGDEEGNFAMGPLRPGTYLVQGALTIPGIGLSPPSEVQAGADSIVLQLRPFALIVGVVVEKETGVRGLATVRAQRAGAFSQRVAFAPHGGPFTLGGLVPGSYSLCAQTKDGRFGSIEGVEASGAEKTEVILEVSRGAFVSLRYYGTEPEVSLWAQRGERRFLSQHQGSRRTASLVLPPGHIDFHMAGYDRRRVLNSAIHPTQSKSLTLRAGQHYRVDFYDD